VSQPVARGYGFFAGAFAGAFVGAFAGAGAAAAGAGAIFFEVSPIIIFFDVSLIIIIGWDVSAAGVAAAGFSSPFEQPAMATTAMTSAMRFMRVLTMRVRFGAG